jgi:bacillopeptidase F
MVYLVVAIILIVGTIGWGLPAVARLSGYLIKTNDEPITIVEDRPTPPIFSDVPEATYSAQVKIAGFAQPGLDVVLFINDVEYARKLVGESGTFEFDKVSLEEGENLTYAYTTTLHDLRSERSKSYTVTLDVKKPTVTIDSPSSGQVFRGQIERIANFSGSVDEPSSKLYIGERMVILQSDGKFSLPYQLVEGDQEIIIKAIDRAGNEGISTINLRWEP